MNSDDRSQDIQDALSIWFQDQKRTLPWRESSDSTGLRDPYHVWVSEIMLQQTQVKTVIPYFERWLEAFPTFHELAAAEQDDVLTIWQGLGYYRRARMLHHAAQTLDELPETYALWLEVPGVGEYTAAAIASLAFGERVPAIDGNVIRVVSRLFEVTENVDKAAGKRKIREHATPLISSHKPGESNEALMELGATICTPTSPSCSSCPVNEFCSGRSNPNLYPVKNPRKKAKKWKPWVVVPTHEEKIGLIRGEKALLGGLWGFETFEKKQDATNHYTDLVHVGEVTHQFTHRDTTFQILTTATADDQFLWVDLASTDLPPMSVAMKKVFDCAREALAET